MGLQSLHFFKWYKRKYLLYICQKESTWPKCCVQVKSIFVTNGCKGVWLKDTPLRCGMKLREVKRQSNRNSFLMLAWAWYFTIDLSSPPHLALLFFAFLCPPLSIIELLFWSPNVAVNNRMQIIYCKFFNLHFSILPLHFKVHVYVSLSLSCSLSFSHLLPLTLSSPFVK